ncbi:MAG TPA: PEP-CTERM sorting domain-containing protein [Gemmataceae bacterium]|nr:PEP-CTERM sorting domain-containing protein [Gemmataceae bacterium]
MIEMTRTIVWVALVGLFVTLSGRVHGAPITVSGYDIDRGRQSGFGGWSNYYNGTVTPNGDGTYAFSGGTLGTINDGLLPTSAYDSQLYYTSDNAVTTLYLSGGPYNVATIELYGFNDGNSIPGNIDSVKVTINGTSEVFSTIGFGPVNFANGVAINDRIDLTGSMLEGLATSKVDIQILTTYGGETRYYQIGEAKVFGEAAAVPEPASLTLLGIMAIGGAAYGWYRRKQAVG